MFGKKIDWPLLIIWALLAIYGIVAIYSASSLKFGDTVEVKNFYLKQLAWMSVSLVFLLALIRIPLPFIEALVEPFYGLSLLLLLIVLFMPEIKGAHRWFNLGGVGFQPSEMAKLATIMMAAKYLAKPHLSEWQLISRAIACYIPPVLLIVLEPDLGTTIVYLITMFAVLAASGLPGFYLVLGAGPVVAMISSFWLPALVIYIILLIVYLYYNKLSTTLITVAVLLNLFFSLLSPVMWNSLREYQKERVLTFLDPTRDPLGAGYQIIQAKIAVGSGGLYGKGYLEGTQKNLNFLPEHHTDFIFSVIGEEFGFVGSLLLITLFVLLFWHILRHARHFYFTEHKAMAAGVVAYLGFHVFINIGMNIGLAPTTGIPLPFISYGGSSLLINSLAVGLIFKFASENSSPIL